MKLKFKNQEFQEAATAAVCDVFDGQPYHDPKINVYTVDPGRVVASSQLSVVSSEASLPGFETLGRNKLRPSHAAARERGPSRCGRDKRNSCAGSMWRGAVVASRVICYTEPQLSSAT